MLLNHFLLSSARAFPVKTALVCNGRRHTYAQILEYSGALGARLLESGLVKGDRVAVYLENGTTAVVSIFGTLLAGGAFLMINPGTKKEKLEYILRDSQARFLIAPLKAREALDGLVADGSLNLKEILFVDQDSLTPLFDDMVARYSGARLPTGIIDVDLASIVYTSGSTGVPKGVTLLHRNMVSAARSINEYLENGPQDIILNVLPLSFDYGLYQVFLAFLCGGTLVLERSFNYPFKVVKLLNDERITVFPGVPTIFTILSRMNLLAGMEFPHLRSMTNTGAAMPVPVLMMIRNLFPKARFYSMYGLTECKRVSYLPPEELDRRPESIGKGMPNEEVYVVREDGTLAGAGEIGELVVRGSNVMVGYWNDPEATDKVLKKGRYDWEKVLYTGDLFKTDDEGYLYFVGRKDDIIKSRGEKVSPREVEDVLYKMTCVQEAAVIGVRDEILGSAVQAHVVLREGAQATEKEIIGLCAERLENFMVPKTVIFHSELPKTSNGKIDKSFLKGRYASS